MLPKCPIYLLLLLGLSVTGWLWLARDAGAPLGEPRAALDGERPSAESHAPLPDAEGVLHARLTHATAATRSHSGDTTGRTAHVPLASATAALRAREPSGVTPLTATGSATRYFLMSLQL